MDETTAHDRLAEFKKEAAIDAVSPIKVPTAAPDPLGPPPSIIQPPLEREKRKTGIFRRKSKRTTTNAMSMPISATQLTALEQTESDKLEMASFFEQTKTIKDNLVTLRVNNEEIEKAQKEILLCITEEEMERWEAVIETFVKSTNKLSLEIKRALQELETDTERLAGKASKGSGDLRMRTLHHASLTRQLAECMKTFQAIQAEFRVKKQGQLERQYKIIRPMATEEELDTLADATGSMSLTSNQIFMLGGTKDLRTVLESMRQRRISVMNIEKGVTVLNQLFVDMQTMVDEQAELLDSIETNVNATVEFVDEANVTMEQAVDTQKNIRKLKCSIF